jgi:hypothetical protein
LADLARAEAFVMDLQRQLAEAQRCHAIAAEIVAEMAACAYMAAEKASNGE